MLLKKLSLSLTVISFIVAAGTAVYLIRTIIVSHQPVRLVFYPWIIIPILITAIPFSQPRAIPISTLMMVVYIFSPFSLSIGLYFVPASAVLLLGTMIDLIVLAPTGATDRTLNRPFLHRLHDQRTSGFNCLNLNHPAVDLEQCSIIASHSES